MTIAEFQAWLDGYSASFGDAPNAEQWGKIKDKIATLAVVVVPNSAYNGVSGGSIGAAINAPQVHVLWPEHMPSQSHLLKGGTCASPLALR